MSRSRAQPSSLRPAPRPKFPEDGGFGSALRERVEGYFEATGLRRRDCPEMYLKTAVLLAAFAACYLLLVFVVPTWWLAVPAAVLLGLVMAGIGMNVQHDASHRAYSDRRWVNALLAHSLDLIGGSSYFWNYQHNVFHHSYVNISGYDGDIDVGALCRLSPHQRRRWFHRWQHLYMWPLYALTAIRWQLYGDFRDLLGGTSGRQRVPRPRGGDLLGFFAGKLVFFSLAFAVPLGLHPWWAILSFYALAAGVLGIVLAVVFQLAHAVEETQFALPDACTGRLGNAWTVHQACSSMDFAPGSLWTARLLGGLNFQIEHHLLPRICHVHYPQLSRIVAETCREFGVRHAALPSFRAGVASHYRWLRRMGAPHEQASAAL